MDVLTALDMLIRSAEQGSFAAAARQLGVTPVAVGKQVMKLERGLGVQLVVRTTRSFALTEAGQRLVAEARNGVAAVQSALDAANQRTDGIVGTLRVNLAPAFGRRYVLPLVGPFLDLHPRLRLDWQFENRHADLVAEGFDLGIAGGVDLAGGLVARTLAPLHQIVITTPAYLDGIGVPPPTLPDELPAYRLIAMRSSSTGRVRPWTLRSYSETATVIPDPRIVVNDPDAVRDAVLAGYGIGLCGLSHVLPDLEKGDLVRLLPGWWTDIGRIVVYYPSSRLLPAKTRAFTDFLTAAFAAKGWAQRLDATAGSLCCIATTPVVIRGGLRKTPGDSGGPIAYHTRLTHRPRGHALSRSITIGLSAAVLIGLAGCTTSTTYSPNAYSSNAVQQANKVEPAVVVGFRQVTISASGTVGAVAGGAAGGILGAQVGPGGIHSALGAVGGTTVGTILGSTIERVTGDTTGWEYIVRKPNGDLLSVTQREEKPIGIGQKVLVITGSQARIVPDYSVAVEEPGKPAAAAAESTANPQPANPQPAPRTGDEPAKEAGADPAAQAPISLRPENSGTPAPAATAPTVTPLPEPPAAAPAEPAPATPAPTDPAPVARTEAPAEPAPPPPSL